MRYTTFGRRTGLRVSELALGTAMFGAGCGRDPAAAGHVWGRRGDGADPDDARAMFDRFAEAGGTLIDTADCYQFGESERVVGDLVTADRDHFVLATKFTNGAAIHPRISQTGNSRKTMVKAVEDSLTRLRTDYLDIYWAHFPDPLTPIEELLAAFDSLVRSGKVLYIGLSNFAAWRVARAATVAELRGWSPVIGVQCDYNLLSRTAERELLPMAEGLGLGAALWSPLAGGLLTGRYRRTGGHGWSGAGTSRVIRAHDDDRSERVVDCLLEVAAEIGASPSQVATAWVRERAGRSTTALVPIVGPHGAGQLDEYLAALDLSLGEEHYTRLERVSAVPAGTPHDAGDLVRDVVLGGRESDVVLPPVPVA